MLRRNVTGDTIVEVMIALAILSSVLGTSFAIASRSIRKGRQAQERTEALKITESQIELLKEAGNKPINVAGLYSSDYALPSPSRSFCFNSATGGALQQQQMVASDVFDDILTVAPTPGSLYVPNCQQGHSSRYNVSIVREDQLVGGTTYSAFVIRTRWDRVGGGRDEVKTLYKLHQGQL
jgi:type II secretory pathway pseudopilin PulG